MLEAEMRHQRAVQMFEVFLPDYKNVYTVIRPVISTQTDHTLQNEWTAPKPSHFSSGSECFPNSWVYQNKFIFWQHRATAESRGGENKGSARHVASLVFIFPICKMR